jgi:dihydropteroate synthase
LSLQQPVVMGIININDDSFYVQSRAKNIDQIIQKASQMIEDGASILDLGVMSSKPGSKISTIEDELKGLLPALELIRMNFPEILISVDTIHSQVASAVLKNGASMINDISAGDFDQAMLKTVADADAPYIMMHMQGLPSDMQLNPTYDDVVMEIMKYFVHKTKKAKDAGIKDLIIDPGFGFGKTLTHNYQLLKSLEVFQIFDIPVLAGVSRKSMIWKYLNNDADHALNGTTALHMHILQKGVKILRVHDVKEAVECVHLFNKLNQD